MLEQPALPLDRCQPGGAVPCGPACQASRHPLFAQRRRAGACRSPDAGHGPGLAPPSGGRSWPFGPGSNGLSTLVLSYLAIRQSRPFPRTAETVAFAAGPLAAFAAHWLPLGGVDAGAGGVALLHQSGPQRFARSITRSGTPIPAGQPGRAVAGSNSGAEQCQINYADVRRSPTAWA